MRSASDKADPASAGSCGYPDPAIGAGALTLQDGYRPVKVVAHLLEALTGDGKFHWCPRLPSACDGQPRLGRAAAASADSEQLAGRPLPLGGKRHYRARVRCSALS